jgi:hypothetical protein
VLVAYLGTGSIVALCYFQFQLEWVITAWAVVVVALLGASLALDKPIFLHQGLLLTLAVFGRGISHNLFGGSYFGTGDWKGDYLVLSSASAILLASLFFAFRLRNHFAPAPSPSRIAQLLQSVVRRPEQIEFFVPVTLLTVMLALKMKTGMITLSWAVEGVVVFLLALVVNESSFRRTGLGLLLLCIGKFAALDFWGLQVTDKYLTGMTVGASSILVSFLATRYRDVIRRYL